MEDKELMIGDWVHIDSMSRVPPHNDKVRKIFEKYCDTDNSFIGWKYVEPIPLTDEILKANGFESHEHELILRKRSSYNEYFHIDFFITTDGVFILDIEAANNNGTMTRVHKVISYVHELQHALRLCGLTEFADNFKVR